MPLKYLTFLFFFTWHQALYASEILEDRLRKCDFELFAPFSEFPAQTSGYSPREGISYLSISIPNKLSIHLLEVDPEFFEIISARPKDGKAATVAEIATEYGAFAAINAGFFHINPPLDGFPLGILKIANEWQSTPTNVRGAIGWSNLKNIVLYDQVLTEVTVEANKKELLINGINIPRPHDQIVLYNRFFYPTSLTSSGGIEFPVRNNLFSKSYKMNTPIPENGYLLSFGGLKKNRSSMIKQGDKFRFNVKVIPKSTPAYTNSKEWDHAEYILGGKPMLIRNGTVITDYSLEKVPADFLYDLHPRTAVGYLPDGHWIFVVIDGRQPNISDGISVPDLAVFMREIGCVEALNLDGGGSAIMIIEDKILNSPCGYEQDEQNHLVRKISDAIILKVRLNE